MMNLDRAFAHPWALWLLLIPPVLSVLALFARRRQQRALASLGRIPALTALTGRRPWLRALQSGCRTLGLTFLIMAIAGPQWGRSPVLATAPGRDLILVLDMSRSMLAEDVLGSSAPNRLGRAKDALEQLIDTLEKRGGHRLALVAFAARPKVACPLTHDYDHVRDVLANLDVNDPAFAPAVGSNPPPSDTRIGAALRLAVDLAEPEGRGYQDILLVSDGDDPAQDQEWQEGIAAARDAQIPIHTVGIGDPLNGGRIPIAGGYLYHDGKLVRSRLQPKPLEQIAARTGGTCLMVGTDAVPLGRFFSEQIESRGGHELPEDAIMPYEQHTAWFFAAAAVFLAFELLLRPAGQRRTWHRRLLLAGVEGNG